MANIKITDLTAYTDPLNTDVLPIVDVTSDTTKKVSIADLLKNASAGTAAAPGIAFDGDSNTGIYRPGADQLALATNGTGRLFISNDGKVGIGVSDPTSYNITADDLVIADPNGFNSGISINITDNTGASNIWFGDSDGEGRGQITYAHGANDYLAFSVGATQRMQIDSSGTFRVKGAGTAGVTDAVQLNGSAPSNSLVIDSTGKVGVGTSSPSSSLHVQANGNVYARIERTTTGTESNLILGAETLSNAIYSRDDASGNKAFEIYTGTTSRLYISDAGNVGIGTTSPSRPFNVSGSDNIYAAITSTNASNAGLLFGDSSNDDAGYLLYANSVDALLFGTAAGERMRIDSTGRVGIGTTSPSDTLHLNGSTGYGLKITDASSHIGVYRTHSDGAILKTASNHALLFGTNDTERMRIDSSGRLLVGTSSSSAVTRAVFQASSGGSGGGAILISAGLSNPGSGGGLGQVDFADSGHTTTAQIKAIRDGGTWTSGSSQPSALTFSTTADSASSPTERMRIDRSGRAMFNTTNESPHTASTGEGAVISAQSALLIGRAEVNAIFNRHTSNGEIIRFNRQGVDVGSIDVTTSATSYNTSSDYRLKENVVPLTGATDRLNQLQVHRFNFIADPDTTVDGFIAHEAQTVVPECVTGTKDEVDDEGNPVYQGIDQSKLVPLLTAALQEALAKIETLEARLTAAGI